MHAELFGVISHILFLELAWGAYLCWLIDCVINAPEMLLDSVSGPIKKQNWIAPALGVGGGRRALGGGHRVAGAGCQALAPPGAGHQLQAPSAGSGTIHNNSETISNHTKPIKQNKRSKIFLNHQQTLNTLKSLSHAANRLQIMLETFFNGFSIMFEWFWVVLYCLTLLLKCVWIVFEMFLNWF